MNSKIKIYISIASTIIGLLISGSILYFISNSIFQLKQSDEYLNKYTKIGDPKNLNRAVVFGEEVSSLNRKHTDSNIATYIYLEIVERTENKQKIRLYIRIHNTSWLQSVKVEGSSVHMMKKFIKEPTLEEIKSMVIFSKNSTESLHGAVFRPREIYLIRTDFELPFPANLNYQVETSFLENFIDTKTAKQITDDIILDSNILNRTQFLLINSHISIIFAIKNVVSNAINTSLTVKF